MNFVIYNDKKEKLSWRSDETRKKRKGRKRREEETKKEEEALQKLQWSFHWSVSAAIIPMVAIAGNKPIETEVEGRMGKETVAVCVSIGFCEK